MIFQSIIANKNLKRIGFSFAVLTVFLFLVYGVYSFSRSLLAKSHTQKGLQALEKNNLLPAKKCFLTALSKNTRFLPAYINLGVVYEKEKEFSEAIHTYEKVLKLTGNPKFLQLARYRLASIYNDASIQPPIREPDWFKQGIRQLEILVKDDPENPRYHLMLGFAAFNAANPGRGFQALSLASKLAVKQEQLWVHEKLLEFYLKINMTSRAQEEQQILDKFKPAGTK